MLQNTSLVNVEELNRQLCAALGLDPSRVLSITIVTDAHEVRVSVEWLPVEALEKVDWRMLVRDP